MNDLDRLYEEIYARGKAAIQSGAELIDTNLSAMEQDPRRALTLVISLRGPIVRTLRMLEEQVRAIEPRQYYYPEADMHVTVIELICATPTLTRDQAVLQQGIDIVSEAIKDSVPFDIAFKGIIVSHGAILARGYYCQELLALRERVRKIAQEHAFDLRERYQSISAHAAIGRFVSKVSHGAQLLKKIDEYHDFEIGTFRVEELELVIHDCYHHRKEEVQRFGLNPGNREPAAIGPSCLLS